jgi:hypothetical protein
MRKAGAVSYCEIRKNSGPFATEFLRIQLQRH